MSPEVCQSSADWGQNQALPASKDQIGCQSGCDEQIRHYREACQMGSKAPAFVYTYSAQQVASSAWQSIVECKCRPTLGGM